MMSSVLLLLASLFTILSVPAIAQQDDITRRERGGQLAIEIAAAERRVQRNPASADAHLQLAQLQNEKADLLNDRTARAAAADHFVRSMELELENGRIGSTSPLSRVLAQLNDAARLDEIFSKVLQVAPTISESAHYLALVDYAAGLARLGRRDADARFEEAIRIYPANNSEAIGRYAQLLFERGHAAKAITVLEQMAPGQRQMNPPLVFLYQRALKQLGRDTSFADAEVALICQRLATPVQGGVRDPRLTACR